MLNITKSTNLEHKKDLDQVLFNNTMLWSIKTLSNLASKPYGERKNKFGEFKLTNQKVLDNGHEEIIHPPTVLN